MRRPLPLAMLMLLVTADQAWAAGGGGTSGFSGGGGGGGFSGGGGGGGGGGFGGSIGGDGGDFGGWWYLVFLPGAIVGLMMLWYGVQWALGRVRQRAGEARDDVWRRRSRGKRVERVATLRAAAAEAADDDAAFEFDAVTERARKLFSAVQIAWDRRDRERLAELAGPELMEEWRLRLNDFDKKYWHNRVQQMEKPTVELVGLTNRADDADDRAVVRIECLIHDYVKTRDGDTILRDGRRSKAVDLVEYWTLAKVQGDWRVTSIEVGREGDHHLDGELVTSPGGDDRRLHDEAVAERAMADALPAGVSPAEVADLDFEGPARAAAQDLALADGRFDPALIEGSVRRAVDAWVTAVDGPDAPLEALARPEAVAAMLHPEGTGSRLVVRSPRVEAITIDAVDAAAQPPEVQVELRAAGRRYVEDRDTAGLRSGSRESETTFTERWTLVLDADGEWPWRIAAVTAPASA